MPTGMSLFASCERSRNTTSCGGNEEDDDVLPSLTCVLRCLFLLPSHLFFGDDDGDADVFGHR